MRILMALATVALIAALAAPALAAPCSVPRLAEMKSNGMTHGRIGVDPGQDAPCNAAGVSFPFDGSEKGVWWETGNPSNGSASPDYYGPGAADSCPIQSGGPAGEPWWQLGGTGGSQPTNAKSIQFVVSSPDCDTDPDTGACPENSPLTVLVEDQTADGSNAGFITYTVDPQLTQAPRHWDFAATDAGALPSNDLTHCMETYPAVNVVASAGPPPNTILTNEYRNIDINFWGAAGSAGNPLDPSAVITAYKVYAVNAPTEPGRARSNWGAPIKTIPYTNTPPGDAIGDSVAVPCGPGPDQPNDTFVAIGIEFDGAIDGYYVGKAAVVECDPTIAEPEPAKTPRHQRLQRRAPLQRGGR